MELYKSGEQMPLRPKVSDLKVNIGAFSSKLGIFALDWLYEYGSTENFTKFYTYFVYFSRYRLYCN